MKKLIPFCLYFVVSFICDAQTTSPTFDAQWAARFQNAINTALPNTPIHGVSVAITFPGMGTFIGVGGESAQGIPITPDMQFCIGSATKTFTAALALKLQELGILSLDDKLSDWLPAYPNVDGAATLRQCLKHQSGFANYTNDFNPNDPPFVYGNTFYTPQQVASMLPPPTYPVGKGFRYSNGNYVLVALAMEAASGRTYTQLLHQYIFDPLDMDSTFLAVYEPPNGNVAHGWYFGDDIGTIPAVSELSIYWCAGAMYSTANEMVQWFDNLFAGNIINQSSLDQMRAFEPSTLYAVGLEDRYPPFAPDEVVDGHGGASAGYSCMLGYDVKRHSSLCILMNRGGEQDGLEFSLIVPIVQQVYNGYTRRPDDAGIKEIISPVSEKCIGSFSFEVLLKNFGTANLKSVKVNYQVDKGPINTYNWKGDLAQDQTIVVTLPIVPVSTGNHSFRSFTSDPNGNSEGYDFNDEVRSNFNVNGGVLPGSIQEGFEGVFPPPGWLNGNGNILNWGKTNLVSLNGSGCVVKDNMDDVTGRSYDLELPLLNLSAMSNPVLSFNLAYGYRKSFADEFSVLVSTDCGASYQVKYQKAGNALKTADAGNLFFSPSDDQWQIKTFNLSSFHGDVLIKLRVTSANGNNLYIDNVRVDNVTDLCTAPTDLDAVQISSSSAKLQWQFHSNASNANRFDVYYRKKGTSSWSQKIVSGNKRWVNVNGLQPDTDYEWYVTATCDAGNSLPSARTSFTTESEQPGITSSSTPLPEEQGLLSQLKIFPNPTNGRAIISFTTPKAGKVSLTIYDITGRVIKTIANAELNEGDHIINLDVKNFRAGIYLLRMQSEGILQTKFIIQH